MRCCDAPHRRRIAASTATMVRPRRLPRRVAPSASTPCWRAIPEPISRAIGPMLGPFSSVRRSRSCDVLDDPDVRPEGRGAAESAIRRHCRGADAARRAGRSARSRVAARDPALFPQKQSRAAADLRRPGGDRDRERAAVQRDQGGARAADRDGRGAAGDQRVGRRRRSRCSTRSCESCRATCSTRRVAACCVIDDDGMLQCAAIHGSSAAQIEALFPIPTEGCRRRRRPSRAAASCSYADVLNGAGRAAAGCASCAQSIGRNYSLALRADDLARAAASARSMPRARPAALHGQGDQRCCRPSPTRR